MTTADYLAKRLRKVGLKKIFGIPGGPSIPYMEAFRKEGIEFILTSHESSAAVMADVTARLTGVTGVCHATFGPGATNLSTGVGGALLDRSPILALTSEMPDMWLGRTAQMSIDHQALFSPITKATFRLSAGNACQVISESLKIANEEYPGPVHIGLPADIAGKSITDTTEAHRPAHRSDQFHIDERVRVLLASSRRPVIAIGLTAVRTGAGERLRNFLETCKVPVVLTPMAKGIIPSGHPCYAGVLFHALSDRLKKLTEEADLVIGIGYDPVEYNYESWLPKVPLLHFDTREADKLPAGAMQFITGPDRWFEALASLSGSPGMITLAGEVRMEVARGLDDAARGFTPATVISILQELLPADAIITADVGSHLHLLGQMWDVSSHGRLIMTNGWSSMGFGLPAAIAAAMSDKGKTVVCVTGDGGFLMHAGEMMTARRYGLKIIVVVLADRELNLISIKESWKRVKPYGTELYKGSLFVSDTFLGAEVMQVYDETSTRTAISRAMLSDKSVIIEAAVDPAVYSDLIVKS